MGKLMIPIVVLLGATFPLTTVALVIANLLGQRK